MKIMLEIGRTSPFIYFISMRDLPPTPESDAWKMYLDKFIRPMDPDHLKNGVIVNRIRPDYNNTNNILFIRNCFTYFDKLKRQPKYKSEYWDHPQACLTSTDSDGKKWFHLTELTPRLQLKPIASHAFDGDIGIVYVFESMELRDAIHQFMAFDSRSLRDARHRFMTFGRGLLTSYGYLRTTDIYLKSVPTSFTAPPSYFYEWKFNCTDYNSGVSDGSISETYYSDSETGDSESDSSSDSE